MMILWYYDLWIDSNAITDNEFKLSSIKFTKEENCKKIVIYI